MKIIDESLLNEVSSQAKASPRLRMNYNFHQSLNDKCHRFLNAVEPGTMMPIHRHLASSETVIIIRGRIRWLFYNEQGRITESTELWSDGDVRMLNVEKGRWHSLECLESGSVLFESKDGPYRPLDEDEVMEKSLNA